MSVMIRAMNMIEMRFPSLLSLSQHSPMSSHSCSLPLASPISPPHVSQYQDQSMSHCYSAAGDIDNQMGAVCPPVQPQHNYSSRSPSITSYTGQKTMDTRRSPIHTQQHLPKYGAYSSYDVEGNICDPSWTQGANQSPITHTNPMNTGSTTPTHSPTFVEGPPSNHTSPEIPYLLRSTPPIMCMFVPKTQICPPSLM
jgi:hypothetical protein